VEAMDNQQEANCLSVITRAIDSDGEKSRAAIDLRIGQSGIGACSNYLFSTIRQGAFRTKKSLMSRQDIPNVFCLALRLAGAYLIVIPRLISFDKLATSRYDFGRGPVKRTQPRP
jgi:hypothetical protein